MTRATGFALIALLLLLHSVREDARGDEVLDWNATLQDVIQLDGAHPDNKANPGWSTRSMAMMNGAIYDVFQAINRTHVPFLYDATADAATSRQAAVHQAAREILLSNYPGESKAIGIDFEARMGLVSDGSAKDLGIALGKAVAQQYIDHREFDHADETFPYSETGGPGRWTSDPFHPGQKAWGPGWGQVTPFAIANTSDFVSKMPGIPELDSPEYAAAYNQVKELGAVDSLTRNAEQTEIGIFWGYDRPTMGPPPVLYLRNLEDIATQANNTPEENARLFAMASVGMADAAIAAWDAKFLYDFWRPVTAIHEADPNTNPATLPDAEWRPLGAPGDPLVDDSDFTPPFPAWPSGHATMGGALFETLKLFYGTNVFDEIDGQLGNDPTYYLKSAEMAPSDVLPGADDIREFLTFSSLLDTPEFDPNSPEWENAISRIYLGIHWIFDATDGIKLGNEIVRDINASHFQAIPEPSALALGLIGTASAAMILARRRSSHREPRT